MFTPSQFKAEAARALPGGGQAGLCMCVSKVTPLLLILS